MSKICYISGKKRNNGYSISHSHIRNKKIQNVNLQIKRIWSDEKQAWVKIKISTKALRTMHKV